MRSAAGITVILSLCLAGGHSLSTLLMAPERVSSLASPKNGGKVVCYYTPTGYFPASKVPSNVCTHLVYAFGSISQTVPNITTPTAGVKAIWGTLTSLRRKNPQLKVLLSLQKDFNNVVGPDVRKMELFAYSAVGFLRYYGFDGVDMDWEYPTSDQKTAFAKFFTIMRTAIDKDAKGSGKPALLLSLALANNQFVASRIYDIRTISAAVDFGTAMTYDFHVYNKKDTVTGYNSPLYTPAGEPKYLSTSTMAEYYLAQGFTPSKLLVGIPTYGRSWALAQSSSHGLHSPAVGKGAPGPVRKLTGVYTYPDACVAIQKGATAVHDSQAGAVYLYHGNTWVAYDDVTTVAAKCQWVKKKGLGGVGVWALHLDDLSGDCRVGSLPLIQTMRRILAEA